MSTPSERSVLNAPPKSLRGHFGDTAPAEAASATGTGEPSARFS